ncbi:jg10554 [Pararge aegeria aegeria]|uniref:Jg10554 protein n=1 Tax=Pararge aegeria aegeria TaxID=348720 RepID=A0A8S4RXN3_9NEOP|nr:jg10554 [Pararge aegeria aegeria]
MVVAGDKDTHSNGEKCMIRLGSIWKNRGITFNTKTRLVRALIFPIFMYGVEPWTIKARERQRIDAFEMWCWRRMLRIPWTAKLTNVSILAQLAVSVRLYSICYQRLLSYFGHIMRRGNGLQQKPMETVYQREVEISPGPRSSVMKEQPERERERFQSRANLYFQEKTKNKICLNKLYY